MMSDLKIGQIVYRYVSSFPSCVFRFEVIGVHQYKNVKQYHVKCLSCNHGDDNCEMLIGYEGSELRFIQMLNNRGDDYDEPNERHWHAWGELFYISREKAIFERLKKCESDYIKSVENAEQKLKTAKENLQKLRAEIESHRLLLKEQK